MLSRGIVGDKDGVPKLASPIYKNTFDLRTGRCFENPNVSIATYQVRAERGHVEVRVPSSRQPSGHTRDLLPVLLDAQQTLTAVERFSHTHDVQGLAVPSRVYRDLIPLERPAAGQQYAFEVDLDACTGCKACVTACHTQNGLEETEIWRTVGLLQGGTADAPAMLNVTSSCHHCVDPACMTGCPVKAYEKDPITGIVRHLDDRCIGCQYCILMCPYDAPKYSAKKGIVRKCDMCSDRLAHHEAPACAQACPSEAIRIRTIDCDQAVRASESGQFLPGTPAPDQTVPTTLYKTRRVVPNNLLPVDYYALAPQHSHPALVLMLVLTQLATGTFTVNLIFGSATAAGHHGVFSLALAVVALGASVFHLGQPLRAWRSLVGLKTSWLSREILAFGLFAAFCGLYALSLLTHGVGGRPIAPWLVGPRNVLGLAAAVSGLAGVLCSVMVYAATGRSHWRADRTGVRFLASTVTLGVAAAYVLSQFDDTGRADRGHLITLVAISGATLLFQAAVFRHLHSRTHSPMKRVAALMMRDLEGATIVRFGAGLMGGVCLPLWLISARPTGTRLLSVVVFLLLFVAEGVDHTLFFKAAPTSRMPGSLC